MRRITLIGPNHPTQNPRLVRDADALARRGYQVRVLGIRFLPDLVPFDEELIRGREWRYDCVDFLKAASFYWHFARARRRVCNFLAKRMDLSFIDRRAYLYALPELTNLAIKEPAELFIAHQHCTLPAAALAAARWKCQFAFDAEDLLADCPSEPTQLIRRNERYLKDCAYISTMSGAASDRLQVTNCLERRPITLHNAPAIHERLGTIPPIQRPDNDPLSIYWFGQTLGPHSCAEEIIRVLPLLIRPVRLVLRGKPVGEYIIVIRRLAEELKVSHLVEIAPTAPPGEMVRLAAHHDILYGSQPGDDLFHLMAIGNKVFTGMMAGLALALRDTIAHSDLMAKVPGCGFLYRNGDTCALAHSLNNLIRNSALLKELQQKSWSAAQDLYNWEMESELLIQVVESVFANSD